MGGINYAAIAMLLSLSLSSAPVGRSVWSDALARSHGSLAQVDAPSPPNDNSANSETTTAPTAETGLSPTWVMAATFVFGFGIASAMFLKPK